MQKIALSRIIREEVIRALVFGISFFAILSVGAVSVAYAANGGVFGEILNLVLTGNRAWVGWVTWEAPGTGIVHNAAALWGRPAADFVKVQSSQSCAAPKCITEINPATGIVKCE
jgi:hypothetical protein